MRTWHVCVSVCASLIVAALHSTVKPGAEIGITFSSGGFSNYFRQPAYQTAAVTTFLSRHNTAPTKLFNSSGRAFPDVAAAGWNFQYVINGNLGHVGGTSAASPAFAGVPLRHRSNE
jgi:tripeptidyl-peptidase-1